MALKVEWNRPLLWEQANQTRSQPFLWEQATIKQQQLQAAKARQLAKIPRRHRIAHHDPRTGLPICDCQYFLQYHSCGCPDSMTKHHNPRYQKHVPSFRKCAVHFLPTLTQVDLACRGFRHLVYPNIPLDTTPRVLPFPCYKHQEECRIILSKEEMSTRLKRNNDPNFNPKLVPKINKELLEQQALRREYANKITPTSLPSRPSLKRRRSDEDEDDSAGEARPVKRYRPEDEPSSSPLCRRLSTVAPPSPLSPPGRRQPSLLDVCAYHRKLRTQSQPRSSLPLSKKPCSSPSILAKTPLILDEWFQQEQKVNMYALDSTPFAKMSWDPNRDNGNHLWPWYGRLGNVMYELGGWIEDEVRILEAAALAWGKRGVALGDVLRYGVVDEEELDM
ncbi:hypothetical protein QBC44DRAFT_312716 [Cladorrhinum sp. PSN332]|nr:hypothetical protein QBC44DRAFT_312716 [Cladorrhinum sp. PSN332]